MTPVISVILLVAVVVVLASVTAVFALSFADGVSTAPQAAFEFTFTASGLEITHVQGDSIAATALSIAGTDPDGAVSFGPWPGAGTVRAGRSATLSQADGDERVRLVWSDGEQSAILAEWAGPDFGGAASTPSGTTDPGQPFIDTDGDGVYDTDESTVAASDLSDGYTSSERLVIPASVTVTSADGAVISAEGISLAGDIEVTSSGADNGLTLDANGGAMEITGGTVDSRRDQQAVVVRGDSVAVTDATVSSNGDIDIDTSGSLDLSGSTLDSTKDGASVTLTGGTLSAPDATITGVGPIDVLATGGAVDLNGATITTTKRGANVDITSTGGDIDLRNSRLDSGTTNPGPGNELTATVDSGRSVTVDGADFDDFDDTLDVTPDAAATGTTADGTTG